ncbi:hypothetical protein A3D78_07620 [Candidatus Gottesmanbacteria bacterium RIFCSPHIGHO2_02_FULL_39_14]|uniref:ABC transporter domain-containing protein n=1 Tax=Candidatus Gottesmanbacteria bacterium RIFCSPHIGHO2_02_FULL_39_14 TaxID=1798383 RepID=A0A1F5ZWF8_9BACT|nr:MAG: hypothetical protein A3D78_07620 [Candidatus Gottesmanbacteria bacterium RIFCSPHIGHO2_02_FULL_39_14]
MPTKLSLTNFYKRAPLLKVSNLSKSYFSPKGEMLPVLDKISLNLYKNEFVSVIGQSGCGKSTLLDCISGLSRPDQGKVNLNGIDITGSIGMLSYMMQDDVLLPWRTLEQNVMLPMQLGRKFNKYEAQERISRLAKIFGLNKFLNYYPYQLSGGMKQRVSLMRACISNKEILLLDEPFAKLDSLTRTQIQTWFLRIWRNNKLTVLMVTHDIDEALYLSNRIYVFSAKPAKIIAEINLPSISPKNVDNLLKPQYISVKKKLLSILHLNSLKFA